jgi:hypothetical protein
MATVTSVGVQIPDGPATHGFAIVPSDTTVLSPTRAIYVGGAGALAVIMNGDTVAVTFSAVPAGTYLDISVTKVMATNTTATLILGLA